MQDSLGHFVRLLQRFIARDRLLQALPIGFGQLEIARIRRRQRSLHHRAANVRFVAAGLDDRRMHAGFCELQRDRIRVALHRKLAGRVTRGLRRRDEAVDRADHRGPASAFHDQRQERLVDAEWPEHVHVERQPEVGLRTIDQRRIAHDARVIDDAPEAAALRFDELDGRGDIVVDRHVESHRADVVHCVEPGEIRFLACAGVYVEAVVGERLGDLQADSGTGAGYQHGLPLPGILGESARRKEQCKD